jgi:hypothetical protein
MDKDTIDMASTSSANAVGDHLQGAASGIMSDDQSMNSNEEDKSNSAYHDDEETASAIMQFDPSKGIKEPSAMDILCGRGRTTSSHPANRRFRELVNRHKDAYQRAKRRDDKTKITYELVELLRSEGRYVSLYFFFFPCYKTSTRTLCTNNIPLLVPCEIRIV